MTLLAFAGGKLAELETENVALSPSLPNITVIRGSNILQSNRLFIYSFIVYYAEAA